ncbi:MAG TPA: DUF2783 domain-containing protein [Azospirillaceae bacterium]|nr:DUF2783 domain-containing protein [Azospirillaceae bacterium]
MTHPPTTNSLGLDTTPRLADPDAVYEALIDAHQGLSPEQSALLNAKLILLLVNQVGDAHIVAAALAEARRGL